MSSRSEHKAGFIYTGPDGSSNADHNTMVEDPSPLSASRADQLSYMADMIDEMQVMANRLDCQTLAAVLAIASSEARTQGSKR